MDGRIFRIPANDSLTSQFILDCQQYLMQKEKINKKMVVYHIDH
jgi:hypothetical protein